MMSDVETRPPDRDEEMSRFTDTMEQCWAGLPDREVIPPHVFEAAQESGNLLGAYSDGRLVGLVFQMPCVEDSDTIYSHAVGVTSDLAGNSIGERLKREQRRHALDHGFKKIKWTYDPLLGRNAKLNIAKIGATVSEYQEDVYESENDSSSGETPADRFVATWTLESERVTRYLSGEDKGYDPEVVLSAGRTGLDIESSALDHRDGGYELDEVDADTVAVEIPRDRSALEGRAEHRWRFATRETFQTLFRQGFMIVDFRTPAEGYRTNSYILTR